MEVNEEVLRAEAAKTFWKTREFDPIQITYVDSDKEKQFAAERAKRAQEHGKDQVKKLPASVQK